MPAAFIGHGSPMNAIETNRYTRAWASFGATIPPPRAILVVSAHWYIGAAAVTAMPRPRTIHDFVGFPAELFAVEYPASGDEELAKEVAELVKPRIVGLDYDAWGLDHGAWSVLMHAFPGADVPVVQIAIDGREGPAYHLELGAKLATLRDDGVLVLGSGNVVHNLSALDWSTPNGAFDWARRFDDAARTILIERPWDIASLRTHPDYALAVPTPEHFLPLLYLAGLAAAAQSSLDVLIEGCSFGSISMTSYTLK